MSLCIYVYMSLCLYITPTYNLLTPTLCLSTPTEHADHEGAGTEGAEGAGAVVPYSPYPAEQTWELSDALGDHAPTNQSIGGPMARQVKPTVFYTKYTTTKLGFIPILLLNILCIYVFLSYSYQYIPI
jgi:hypothetical protein